uniref:F-box domain-containing protein n=1 Tax=Caenorhabditis tropicalis TaxID=1561998 RepID=A0A1I7U4A7_9PELO
MSTEFQFPLLKLPWVCLEHFLNTSGVFNVFDLITFSLISKRCYRIVKLLKHRELKAYDFKIDDSSIEIRFVRSELKIIGKWKLDLGEEWKTNPFMELFYINPEDKNWVPSRALQLLTNDPESSVVNAFQYLMALFSRPVEQIFLELDEFNQSERIFRSLGIDQCNTMCIEGNKK